MGTYLDWNLGGLVPSWIVDVKWGFGGASSSSGTSAGRADSTVTLHCCTYTRDEIETFKALMTPVFTNTNLLNGGTDLQVTPDGQILVITNGPYTWNGIISSVQFDEDEYATIDGEAAIEFDIIIELQRSTSQAIQPLPDCILFTNGFKRAVQFDGEGCDMGTLSFNWDGTGSVFLASTCSANPNSDNISCDNVLIISTPQGTITRQTGPYEYPFPPSDYPVWEGPDVDITSLLVAGNNTLMIQVVDSFILSTTASPGNLIGVSSLYVIQENGANANGISLVGFTQGSCGNKGPLSIDMSGGGSSAYPLVSVEVSNGFRQAVIVLGQRINLGVFHVNWDGNGKIYLASSATADPAHDLIWADDQVQAVNPLGVVEGGYHDASDNVITGPDIDVTSLFSKGSNTVTIWINDIYGTDIGCSSLWLIQVDS